MQAEHVGNHELLDLMALVREVVHDYGATTLTHTIKYRGDASRLYSIFGDKKALKTLLLHLLDNVVHSLEAIHELCITVLPDQEDVMVMVEECGRNIARRERGMGFLPFVLLDEALDVRNELESNLVVVKMIADNHNATVSMQGSRGQGSAFAVRFRGREE